MIKQHEINDPYSCWNRALPFERVFPILERDPAAPAAIRAWAAERIRLGCNQASDAQIFDAEHCAAMMEHDQPAIRRELDARSRRYDRASKAKMGQRDTPMAQDGTREPRSR